MAIDSPSIFQMALDSPLIFQMAMDSPFIFQRAMNSPVIFQMAKFWIINLVKLAGSRETCALQCWDGLVAVSLDVHRLLASFTPSEAFQQEGEGASLDLLNNIASKLTNILLICLESVSHQTTAATDMVC